jgi:hypothetical protein
MEVINFALPGSNGSWLCWRATCIGINPVFDKITVDTEGESSLIPFYFGELHALENSS